MAGRNGIVLHNEQDFVGLRAAGRLAAATLDMITPYVKPGVTTGELDRIIHEYTLEHGAIPAPLNYRGFPKSCCISINHVVCHGIPGEKTFRKGISSILTSPPLWMAGMVITAGCTPLAKFPSKPQNWCRQPMTA